MTNRILVLATAATLLLSGAAIAQTQRTPSTPPPVNLPPAVSLERVGKQVSPGVYEVNPESVRGKRLVIEPMNQQVGGPPRRICIGKWRPPNCNGIYLELGPKNAE
jgi:hypothetical protein